MDVKLRHAVAAIVLLFPAIAAGMAAWSQQPDATSAPTELRRIRPLPEPMTGLEVVTLAPAPTVIELEPMMVRGQIRRPTRKTIDIMARRRWHDIEEGIKVCQ